MEMVTPDTYTRIARHSIDGWTIFLKLYWALTSSPSSQLYFPVINTRGRKQSNRARDFKPICQLEFRYLHQNCDAQHFPDPNNVQPYDRDTPKLKSAGVFFCLLVYKFETFCGVSIHHLEALVQKELQN